MVAFVGPNEAGKSSILAALMWLQAGGELPAEQLNRTIKDTDADREVVAATYVLDQDDLRVLEGVDFATPPRTLGFSRHASGRNYYSISPRVARPTTLREAALRALSPVDFDDDEHPDVVEALDRVRELADGAEPIAEWSEADHASAKHLITWIDRTLDPEEGEGGPKNAALTKSRRSALESAVAAVRAWQEQMARPAPGEEAWKRLEGRRPEFLIFTDEDRVLGDAYSLAFSQTNSGGQRKRVPHQHVTDPPVALSNLLELGGTSMNELYDLVHAGTPSRVLTREAEINEQLERAISPYWQQRPLAVAVRLEGTTLRVNVREEGDYSLFSQRSDGVRTFIALVAFLACHRTDPPPVLLIDEAETHLHYDAQADLVSFLPALASKTLYTTHSPGCLPTDLGRGIRLVVPTALNLSELRNDFWTYRPDGDATTAGYMPLLFAMGAGAAAFSRFRAAVFTEGPADMMLLPALLTAANDLEGLPYQIVPGLSNTPPHRLMETDLVAAKVAYLVDGDEGGAQHRRHLKRAGIEDTRIRSLPKSKAVEDLIAPHAYLSAVNAILSESGKESVVTLSVLQSDIDQGLTIASAVTRFLGDATPGKPIVANRLLETHDGEPPLAPGARRALRTLHERFLELLELN